MKQLITGVLLLIFPSLFYSTHCSAATTTSADTTSGVILTVYEAPTIPAFTVPEALCAGLTINPTAPTVDFKGAPAEGNTKGWLLGGAAITMPYEVTYADNGKTLQYWAKNLCDSVATAGTVAITVYSTPTVSEFETPDALCATSKLILTPPEIDNHGTPVTGQGWLLGEDAITMPYTPTYADSGKKIYYWAKNKCNK